MGFDKPDEPIKTVAERKAEAEKAKKEGLTKPKPSGPSRRTIGGATYQKKKSKDKETPSTGLVDTKTREQIKEHVETRPSEPEKVTPVQPVVPKDMFYVSPQLKAVARKTQPKVRQLDEKITRTIKEIETHSRRRQKVEKEKAKELAGTGQFYVSPALKRARNITEEDVDKLIEVAKQEWKKKPEKEKQKMMAMAGSGQFGVAPTLRDKQLGVVTSAQQMEKHLDDMKTYNTKVTAFNKHIEEVNDQVDLLNDRANKLPMDTIEKYNDKIADINRDAAKLEAAAGNVNLEDKGAVDAYNKKVRELNYRIADLENDEFKVQQANEAIDKFNRDVKRVNQSLEDNKAPIAPATPRTTVGGTMVLAEEGLKVRWAEATAKELSTTQKAANVSGLLAEMFVPGVWARNIKGMSGAEIGINVALDIAILVPFVRLAGFGIKAGLRALPRGLAKQMMKAEAKQIARTRAVIKGTYGEAMAESFDDVARVQLKYFDTLTKLQKAKGAKAAKLEKAAQASKEELEATARTFSEKILKQGVRTEEVFPYTPVADAFKRMPGDLVKHTQQAAEMAIKPKAKLKAAEKELAKAQASLDAAQSKFPADPAAWGDLVADVMAKRQQVAALKGADAVKLAKELTKARTQLAQADANLKRVAKGSDVYPSLVHSRNLAQAKATAAANRLRSAILSMEVYAGTPQGGFLGRMGVAAPTKVRPPLTTLGTGTGTGLRTGTKASTAAIVAALAKSIPKDSAQVIVGDIDDPKIATYVVAKTLLAVDLARTLRAKEKAMTDSELRERIKEQIKDIAKNAPRVEFRTELSTKAKAISKAALKVALPTKVPIKVPPLKPKLIPRFRSRKDDKQKRKLIKQAGGAVGLRMGKVSKGDVWLVKVKPYTGPQITLVGKKPKGARTVKGPSSGYKSAFYYGDLPNKTVRLQAGYQPILIVPTDGRVKAMFPEPISISKGAARISPKPPRITPKPARITR